MPLVQFDYPAEDGDLAVSLSTFRSYCTNHQCDPQTVLHTAIRSYFDGLCDDNGKLFPIADNRIRHADKPSGLRGLKHLAASRGLDLHVSSTVSRTSRIEVDFPDHSQAGRITLRAFLTRCRFIDEAPAQVIQHAVWQLLVKQHALPDAASA